MIVVSCINGSGLCPLNVNAANQQISLKLVNEQVFNMLALLYLQLLQLIIFCIDRLIVLLKRPLISRN